MMGEQKQWLITEKRIVFVHYIVPADTEAQAKKLVLEGDATEYVDDTELYNCRVFHSEEWK
jgi:hypothetical protein